MALPRISYINIHKESDNMKLEINKISKASFKNATVFQNEEGTLVIQEDLGDKGIETRELLTVIEEIFGDEPFSITLQSKLEI